ncbi:MAG: 4a-hydroxytetrahydrobiopterin dehydratase [Candidatus Nanohaloarchaea archaeon]|nr:4a-hydroxytetrahydrobiopterin dehydratase [Candidatus Nanohaloarchaea archaeon]
MAERLDMEEIIDRIGEYEGWEQEGAWLRKRYEFDDFAAAVAFVDEVAEVAEDLGHHPDITVQNYNEVVLSITSHEEGGITETDFAFVDRVESLE